MNGAAELTWSRSTAIHEAGHAIAWLALGIPVKRVEVRRRHGAIRKIGYSGLCTRAEVAVEFNWTVTVCYAGPIAEARYTRKDLLAIMLCGAPSPESDWSLISRELKPFDAEGKALYHKLCEQRARRIVKRHWAEILSLADQLVANGVVINPTCRIYSAA